jgi:hypothetical protein
VLEQKITNHKNYSSDENKTPKENNVGLQGPKTEGNCSIT